MFWFYLVLSFMAGAALGAVYFGGLWWTVQKITGNGKPYLLFIASFAVRTVFALSGFYFILSFGWQNLLTALAGFLVCRMIIAYKFKLIPLAVARTKPSPNTVEPAVKEDA